jgi:hypothetical protein
LERPLVLCLENVRPRPLEWIWPGRIARGKLCLLDGDPGQGKSLLTLELCARLTRGDVFPDGAAGGPPANVLLVGCEDTPEDTLVPRLLALGAERSRIFAYQGWATAAGLSRLPSFPRDLPELERLIQQTQSRLAVLDPWTAFLDAAASGLNELMARRVLMALGGVAERTGCALLLVRHLRKSGRAQALYRGTGSIGIIATIRSAFLLGRDPEDPNRRVLACLKCNFGPPPPALAFTVAGPPERPQVVWEGPTELTADQLLAVPPRTPLPRQRAVAFLQQRLRERPRPAALLLTEARTEGISESTLQRAKRQLNIEVRRQDDGEGKEATFWALPVPRDPVVELLGQLLPPLNEAELAVSQYDLDA